MQNVPKKLTVRRPAIEYRELAQMLREQNRNRTPLGESYSDLASAIEIANGNPFGFRFALGILIRKIAARVGKLQEVEARLAGTQLRDDETAQWLIGFLVSQEEQGRYNKTQIDACRIAGEALRVHANLPRIAWKKRYHYAAPPNLGRRIPVSA